ncbi:phage portal protein [Fusobacterium varium]|uniref:phage portal protein n=1 Tax=Fusobacterium varium TaxID=856 RepID=UPI00356564B9
MRIILTHEEIIKDIDTYILKHAEKIKNVSRYRKFFKNEVGRHYKSRIIKNLRLKDEVAKWLNADGTILIGGTVSSELTIDDIIVESTLPKAAVNTLKTYSVGEAPYIDVLETEKDWKKDFDRREKIHDKTKQLVEEMLVTGNAFVKIEKGETGKAEVIVLPVENVIIVPETNNISRVGAYIYFCELEREATNGQTEKYKYIEIYQLDGKVFVYQGENDKEPVEVDPTTKEINLHHVCGLEKDGLYGKSIFEGTETTLLEIVIRLTSNSYLFNKVNNPTLVGSKDFSELNTETGKREVPTGKYLNTGNPDDANALRYVESPTAHVTAIYQHMEMNLQNIYAQLGINEVALGLSKEGNTSSGEAFKKAITSTLNKCRDITTNLYIPLYNIYRQAYLIEKQTELSFDITFKDGISLSEKEKIENEVLAASNMLLSRKSILINRGFTDIEADKELEAIKKEQNTLFGVSETIDSSDLD